MTVSDIKTSSRLVDDLVEYILSKYEDKLADAGPSKGVHIEIGNSEFLQLVVAKGRRFYETVQNCAVKATSRYWKKIIVEEKVPLDAEQLKPLLDKIADGAPKTRDTIIKQQIVKEDITGRSELIEEYFAKMPVTFSFTDDVIKLISLSTIEASSIDRLVCFDCNVMGMDDQQAIIDKLDTEKSALVPFENYIRERDGPIKQRIFQDIQYLLVEEIGNEYSKKKNLRKIHAVLYGDFVGKFEFGNKCRITGFYRTIDIKGKPEKDFLIEVVNVQRLDDEKEAKLSDEELAELQKAAKENPDEFLVDLAKSFASHINENYIPKLGVLLCCIGSADIKKYRRQIHVYLVGEGGLAKSELLKNAKDVRYLAVYTDSKSASARGLTYGQEEFRKRKILRAGLVVKNELLCLDETDKMGDQADELNTTMEQQQASYHKTPFDIDTPINISVLAAGNPQGGKWLDERTLMDNLKPVRPELLSRFLIIRVFKTRKVRERVQHMLDVIADRERVKSKYSEAQVAGWISYTRKLNPILTLQTEKEIVDFAEFFEQLEQDKEIDIDFGPRQEVDIIRFSIAFAKILGSTTVDEICVRIAIKFLKSCMQTLGMRTEVAPVQLNLQDQAVNKDQAFWKIIRDLQNNSEDGCFTEAQLLEKMLELEMHWKTKEAAHGYWNRFSPAAAKSEFWEPKVGRYKKI